MTTSGPKFVKREVKNTEKPKTEADVMARSAEVVASGKKKLGAPKKDKNKRQQITVTLPENIVNAIDVVAEQFTGENRSLALTGVLKGKFKLVLGE